MKHGSGAIKNGAKGGHFVFRSVTVERFRGFYKLVVEPLERFNLILGKNNVGKTAFLEALYLLMGPTNTDLPIRINAFRGIERFKVDAEDLWGWLFYKKDMREHIKIEAKNESGRSRKLEIFLDEPKTSRVLADPKTAERASIGSTGTSTVGPMDLVMKLETEDNERTRTRAFLKESTIEVEREKTIRFPNSIYMTSRASHSSDNAERFSKLEEEGKEGDLVPALNVLEPRLKRLTVLVAGTGPIIYGDIGIGRLVPLPMMGDGIGKLLTLLLSIAHSKDAVILVDEIESGLHYSVMSKVWTAVATFARNYNVQVVATTHSWECLKSAHESFSAAEKYDLRVHRFDRGEHGIKSVSYDKEMVQLALDSGMELR